MQFRVLSVACLAASCGLAAAGATSAAPRVAGPVAVSLPAVGDVTVERLVLQPTVSSSRKAPRLALAGKSAPAGVLVASSVAPTRPSGRFLATVAVFRPGDATQSGRPAKAATIAVRIPAGFALVSRQAAPNVLHQNAPPRFALVSGGTASLLAGDDPKLPAATVVRDAQLLALDRSVPLTDLGLLRLEAVAVTFGPLGTSLKVSIGLAGLGQVNAVELKFRPGTRVVRTTGPEATDALPMGTGVQLIASRGFFQDGETYAFTLELSQAPKKGDVVLVRASTHYFESSLPFTERFVLG